MTIAVTTPTGRVGSAVVAHLVRAGVRPRLLLRDPARLPADLHEHVDAVVADLTDPDALRAGLAGVHTLYWVSPTTGGDDPVADHRRLGEQVVAAMAGGSVRRVVFQSSVGAEARHGMGEIDGLAAVEEQLDATGLDVTHLRCGYFFSNLLLDPGVVEHGRLTTTLPADHRFPWVAPDDIAAVAAGLLLAPWHGRRVRAVHGPRDLSFADVAETLSTVLGRPVTVERISDEEQADGLCGLGLTEAQIDALVGMSAGMRDGFIPEQPRDATTTTPTTLGAWAWQALGPGAAAHR